MDREPASGRTFERCPECDYSLPKHSWQCQIGKAVGRRNFLKNAAALTAAGVLGLSVGIPLGRAISPGPTTNYELQSQAGPYTHLLFTDGTNWFDRRGSDGKLNDSSSGDPTPLDPVPMINRIMPTLGKTDTVSIYGDFSSANSVNFTSHDVVAGTDSFGGYFHYGKQSVTGNNTGITIDDDLSGFSDYTNTGMKIYVRRLEGDALSTGSSFQANSIGFLLKNCMQHHIEVGEIDGFQYGIQVAPKASNGVVNDNEIRCRTMINNNYGVRFLAVGGGGNNSSQGNEWWIQILYPNHGAFGIVKDAGMLHQYNMWFYLSMVNIGGGSGFFVNNPGKVTALTLANSDYVLALYWVQNASNVVGTGDTLVILNPIADAGGIYGSLSRAAKFGLAQKQLGLGYASITSLAVTFPMPEQDTSYSVLPTFNFNSGGWWITSKTTAGCTINTVNSNAGGTVDYMVYR